jgi:hypothetical protein
MKEWGPALILLLGSRDSSSEYGSAKGSFRDFNFLGEPIEAQFIQKIIKQPLR